MFNVGGPEIVVILLVALVILGPEQLPKAMRTFGNVMAEIRKVSGGFQAEMRKAIESIDDSDTPTPGTNGSATSRQLATSPEEADVTEVVARNPPEAPAEEATSHDPGSTGGDSSPGGPPVIGPADRAAG